MTSTTAVGAGTVVEPAERRLSPIPGVPAETSIADALRLMSKTSARYLPVHANGRFVGLVSERDLLSALAFDLATSQDPVCALALASTPTHSRLPAGKRWRPRCMPTTPTSWSCAPAPLPPH